MEVMQEGNTKQELPDWRCTAQCVRCYATLSLALKDLWQRKGWFAWLLDESEYAGQMTAHWRCCLCDAKNWISLSDYYAPYIRRGEAPQ